MRVAKLARAAWAAAACLVVLGGTGARAAVIPGAAERVLALVNQERSRAGVPPLTLDPQLTTAAQDFAEKMGTAGFYAHNGPGGSTPLRRMNAAGFPGTSVWGENIAAAYQDPQTVVQAWMASPGHRGNILNPAFTHLGVGAAFVTKSQWKYYWVQDFGVRRGGDAAGAPVGGPATPGPRVQPPALARAEPDHGTVGDTVALVGRSFGSTAGTVSFSGTPGRIVRWTDTRIEVQVPAGASSGSVYVQNSRGTSQGVSFTVPGTASPAPTTPQAAYIYPAAGNPGTRVTIYGRGFGHSTGRVRFNGADGQIVFWYDTLIGVTVPAGAASGPVEIRAAAGSSASLDFTVNPGDPAATEPQLVYCSPSSGAVGSQVSVIGRNLGSAPGTVSFNGVAAAVLNWTSSAVVVIVPEGAETGEVKVQTGAGSSNGIPFTVLDAASQPQAPPPPQGQPQTGGSTPGSRPATGPAVGTSPYAWLRSQVAPKPAPAPAPPPADGNLPPSPDTGHAAVAAAPAPAGLPAAVGIQPAVAAPASTITVQGSGFGTIPGWVRVGRQYAPVLAWNDTQISARVPANIGTNGRVIVRVVRPDYKATGPLYLGLAR